MTETLPGANQSIAFAKAGGHVFHAGNFGHDAVWIKDYMAENGVDMQYAKVKENEVRENITRIFPGCEIYR